MNVARLGNATYTLIKDDAAACAAVRTEAASLAYALLTDPNAAASITSATINGQSFSSKDSMSQNDRLNLLRWVIACLDCGSTISTTQIPTF
tara:strand:+ start:1802 stop:2077 length:276 start_codon:yes stop_codon:yes gene_type:complete